MRLDRGQIEVVGPRIAGLLRQKTPSQRIAIGFALWTSARNMLLTHLSHQHPEWDRQRLHLEVARRLSHGAI